MAKRARLLGLPLVVAACATVPPADIPAVLAPEPNESLRLTLAARGVQIYQCRVSSDGKSEWAFVAPEAELFDNSNHLAGNHGAGPFWQALDGSRVVGTLKHRVDAPEKGAIPWLLVATRDSGPPGRFAAVTSIQRVNTAGGAPPATGCGPDNQGSTARVPYTADYRFYTRN